MTGQQLLSASITNLDGNTYGVVTANSAGNGAAAVAREISDTVVTSTAGLASTLSTYKMVRLPTNVKIKKMELSASAALDTTTGLVLDVGSYYSDSTTDGTPAASQGVAIAVDTFAAASTIFQSSAVGPLNVLIASHFTPEKRNLPLWKACGLSADPGGFIDIVVAVHTAATSGGIATMGLSVTYTE